MLLNEGKDDLVYNVVEHLPEHVCKLMHVEIVRNASTGNVYFWLHDTKGKTPGTVPLNADEFEELKAAIRMRIQHYLTQGPHKTDFVISRTSSHYVSFNARTEEQDEAPTVVEDLKTICRNFANSGGRQLREERVVSRSEVGESIPTVQCQMWILFCNTSRARVRQVSKRLGSFVTQTKIPNPSIPFIEPNFRSHSRMGRGLDTPRW